ncbi:MAG: hypothetical protein GWP69_17240 [Gammaproteobacteria bacterium]|jgi:hypothetical protein|nr:hypothetical protein [Gammaproteobacteria bacterium]NCF81071.1 hypothetical protein [Pseudomonadota bacterium]
MKSRDSKSPKKPYHRPRLLVYGDLRTLTQALGPKGMFDNVTMTTMTFS